MLLFSHNDQKFALSGTVGSVVDTSGRGFEPSYRFKDEIKQKEAGNGPFNKLFIIKSHTHPFTYYLPATLRLFRVQTQAFSHSITHPTIIALWLLNSVTRLGDLLDFVQVFKAFGNN